jgi:hypothetical protein
MITFLLFLEVFLIGALIGTYLQPKGEEMTINRFAVLVSKREGLKKELTIAQIMEVLSVANSLLGGILYSIIKLSSESSLKDLKDGKKN